ncbi:MAG: hypothetical protein ACXVB4_18765 [Pseudobdellovibrionaceae bacterium]
MKLKIMASLAITALAFSTNAKAESYCTPSEKNTLEILNGKGSLTQTNLTSGQTHTINITSFTPANDPSESSDDSIWKQSVIKTESFIFEGTVDNSTEVHTGGMIKFYLKNGDVALLFVGGELESKNFGTQNSCK